MLLKIRFLMSKLHSQDYLLRELVSRQLWKQSLLLCNSVLEKRQEDIQTIKDIQRALQEKVWEEEE